MDTPVIEQLPAAPTPPPAPAPVGNGLAVAGMVLGIIGVLFGLPMFLFPIAGILGVLAIVFGAIGRGRAKKGAPHSGVAMAGFVTGIVAVVLSVIGFFVTAAAIEEIGDGLIACEGYTGVEYFECLSEE